MKKIIFSMLVVSGLLCSCNEWFDVAPKETYMDEKTLFGQESAFRNAMNGIYTELRADQVYGSTLTLGGVEFMGQNFVPDNDLTPIAQFNYTDWRVSSVTREVWNRMINAIRSCNNLTRIFNERTEVSFIPGSREMMMAELKALRAFLHFELVRMFHPTVVSDGNFRGVGWIENNNTAPQMLTNSALLSKIETELAASIAELKKFDPLVTGVAYDKDELLGTTAAVRKMKMNYYAALGIKARVCMAQGTATGYTEARTCAAGIIESGIVTFSTASVGNDLAFSGEYLFGLASTNYIEDDESTYKGIGYLSEMLFTERSITVSPGLNASAWKSSAPNDLRIKWFNTAMTSIEPKFKPEVPASGQRSMQRIPVIKLGEIYLIAAEAALKLNDRSGAYGYLNTFATQRFRVTSLTAVSPEADFRAEILTEYRREFLGEGQLFHYYKRENMLSITGYDGTAVTMDAAKYSWPIPQY